MSVGQQMPALAAATYSGSRTPSGTVASSSVRWAVVALLVLVSAAFLVPGGYVPLSTAERLVSGAAALVALYAAAFVAISGVPDAVRGVSRWRMGPWFLIWGTLAFGASAVTWLTPQTGSATAVQRESVVAALGVAAVGLVVWSVGYYTGPPTAVRTMAGRAAATLLRGTGTTIRGAGMPWALYGIGSAGHLATAVLAGRFGYLGDPTRMVSEAAAYGQVLHVLSTCTLFGIAGAAYRRFHPDIRGSAVPLVMLLVAEVAVGAFGGGKQSFVLAVLAVLIPYGACRGRVPLRLLLVGALLFLWVAVPFNSAYRHEVRGSDSALAPAEAVAVAPEVLTETVTAEAPGPMMVESTDQMLYRVRLVDSVAAIVQRTPEQIDYRNPLDLVVAPVVGLIPRAVWPDKPVYTPGYEFGQEYFDIDDEVYSARAVTPLGDLYRHGGWPVVVAGMLMLGMACRLFDRFAHPERDPRAIAFALVFLPTVVKFEQDMYGLLMSLPVSLATAVLGAHMLCRRSAGGQSATGRQPASTSP